MPQVNNGKTHFNQQINTKLKSSRDTTAAINVLRKELEGFYELCSDQQKKIVRLKNRLYWVSIWYVGCIIIILFMSK